MNATAASVPGGMDFAAFFKSPLRFDPANGSVTAGKNRASSVEKELSLIHKNKKRDDGPKLVSFFIYLQHVITLPLATLEIHHLLMCI